ncbi:hypothetical protein [[Mycobacterium] nativiensis]|uniref:Tail terminator n=1 Tax=[Mycobacterium] nativiensis TaxID=2855503 RepID=A0ABU5XSX2_9MYCO|nr:hypothetical protein [Mycolicibacter sp. MYC340]MEB3031079.1 hypothetical protein [Mycolicibacter sp. MYC340]
MIRVQSVVLPLLRAALPGVEVVSWVHDVDYRTLPMISVRRAGGTRNPNAPTLHSLPMVELTAVSADGLVEAEELYDDALDVLFAAHRAQTIVTGVGYIQSLTESQGPTEAPSPPDTWAVAGTIRAGIKPERVG